MLFVVVLVVVLNLFCINFVFILFTFFYVICFSYANTVLLLVCIYIGQTKIVNKETIV